MKTFSCYFPLVLITGSIGFNCIPALKGGNITESKSVLSVVGAEDFSNLYFAINFKR